MYKSQLSRSTEFIVLIKSIFCNLFHVKSLFENRKVIQQNRKRVDEFLFELIKNLKNFN